MNGIEDSGVLPGTNLGSYRIKRLLGRGGMGTVYLAHDTKLRRDVAIKVVTGPAESAVSRALLLREARSAAALNHPNVCTVYDVGEADGAAFIAMEYVDGTSLRERLDRAALSPRDAVRYAREAADALAYAHEHGVVHGDLKAANVMLGPDARLKVVDFGLARRRFETTTDGTTVTSVVPVDSRAGTPYAMAPEQVRGEPADPRTDVWALGVLLYEMLQGRKPFEAATTADMFSAILRDPPRAMSGDVPVELRAVVERCLEKDPRRRYPHASDVAAVLELAERRDGQAAESRPRGRRRRWIAAASLFAAGAAVLAALNAAGVRDRIMGRGIAEAPVMLAVLPFEDLTESPEQGEFIDGWTEELARMLVPPRSPRLRVIPNVRSMTYKGSREPADRIGRELEADAVLKGSVARTGDRLRIDAELVRASDARTLWNETYHRDVGDLFALEREISEAVLGVLGVPSSKPGSDRRAERRPPDPAAHDFYLRGLSHAMRNNERDVDQAIALFEKAVDLDPEFAPAHAHLAMCYGTKAANYRPNDPQWEEKGFAAARKAMALDPDSPEAHYAQAVTLWRPTYGFPSREALLELRKALAVDPDFDEALYERAFILSHVGHLDAALRELRRAIAINPANTVARFRLAPIYICQQRFDDALAVFDSLPRDAFQSMWTGQKALALISLDRLDEAERLLDDALENDPVDQGGSLHAARAMIRAKRHERREAEADIAEAVRSGRGFIHFHHTAYSIAAAYAALGDLDKAQEWIERAANTGFPNYTFFHADVNLAPLRASPRFRAFLEKLREEWEHIPGEPD